ncbi:MAG: hypothetical protein M1617_02360 [Actinobacteria bacterium]|nr:hypothetical protein [Actinomycetota bacterium]MCL5887132.1 hypothetical protein [Actinomycetota bacterium]
MAYRKGITPTSAKIKINALEVGLVVLDRRNVSSEDIGIRAFQIRKAKAVERAMDRLRHALKANWAQVSSPEIEEIEWVLGEVWAYVARDEWDKMRFGHLTMADLYRILSLGRQLRQHSRGSVEILTEVAETITERSS